MSSCLALEGVGNVLQRVDRALGGRIDLPQLLAPARVEDRADDATVDVCQEVVGPAVPIPSGSVPEFTPNPSPVMTCLPVALSGGTSFSRDGITWTSGPDLPRSTAGGQYVVTVGERGLVASDSSRPAEVWYSPLEPFLTSD